jgi:peptidyl-prolyl cis-trans isomerase B (cyclophilin B)
MNKLVAPFLFLVVSLVSSCAQDTSTREPVFTISTKYGDMIGILYDKTPQHKANFIKLVKEGYYNGTLFHRVVKDFMIQGGDPDSKVVKPGQHLGNGGPGYTIPAEILPEYYHEKGALAAARLVDNVNPEKASSGSQFYIVEGKPVPVAESEELKVDNQNLDNALRKFISNPIHKSIRDSLNRLYVSNQLDDFHERIFKLIPQLEKETGYKIMNDNPEKIKIYTTLGGYPSLDGKYTVFGKVIKGLEVIDKIAMVQGDEVDRPLEDIPVTISIDLMSRDKIAKEYGYKFPSDTK